MSTQRYTNKKKVKNHGKKIKNKFDEIVDGFSSLPLKSMILSLNGKHYPYKGENFHLKYTYEEPET